MYIAFRWLVTLALAMWVAMCFANLYVREHKTMNTSGFNAKLFGLILEKNNSVQIESKSEREKVRRINEKEQSMMGFHIMIFVAGALVVSIFNIKREILLFVKRKIALINIHGFVESLQSHLKNAAIAFRVTMSKCFQFIWEMLKMMSTKGINIITALKMPQSVKQYKIHHILLNKLKELSEERKNLGQLLIAAIHENKNIRMRYQLETMTKNRLVQHIEDTQKQIKENRSRYVSFQQLYLVTHQENAFLKARLRKLSTEKEEAEKNLMCLINEVYKSKNKELKAYCSRFIVKTKDNLLNSDVSEEIQKFLGKSRKSSVDNFEWSPSRQSKINACSTAESWPKCSTRVTEILNEDDSLVPLVTDAPRLKGLPGEYVWTIKDKDGVIEKLYEYDYESDYDNGDTLRRIRQYSVYYDKDCLLDYSSSKIVREDNNHLGGQHNNLLYPLANQRLVTGSEAFKKFLERNNSIVQPARSSDSPFLYN